MLEQRYSEALSALLLPTETACSARLCRLLDAPAASQDVCLFVTHATQSRLKDHVVHHVRQLQKAGVDVVLVINTDLPAAQFHAVSSMLPNCRAVFVRENRGYDFGAWAHVALEMGVHRSCRRLFFINDSIFGPVSTTGFRALIDRIRISNATVIGLTESLAPQRHLQSYFWLLQGAALERGFFEGWMGSIRNLPSKDLVIATYETRSTNFLQANGFTCEALFPTDHQLRFCSNDTGYRWKELIEGGFPYVKVSVLQRVRPDLLVPDAVGLMDDILRGGGLRGLLTV